MRSEELRNLFKDALRMHAQPKVYYDRNVNTSRC